MVRGGECKFCVHGYRGSDVECVNGVLIDIDVYTEGWQRDTRYPPAPCHPNFCQMCNGSGEAPDSNKESDDCPSCNGSGYVGGKDDCQERLASNGETTLKMGEPTE